MRAHLKQLLEDLSGSFWLLPALLVLAGIGLAEGLINAERSRAIPPGFVSDWLYSGGETGARTLLGAVAGSTIGVAGTIFSITIATLTLASSQMGPRLLTNFTRDRGNQTVLGAYLGTFAYALVTLRSVHGADQGAFVPHLAISGAVLLAMVCVGLLVFFVNHVAHRINFDTVINLLAHDMRRTLESLATDTAHHDRLPDDHWSDGDWVASQQEGYIRQLDQAAIVAWAKEHNTSVRLYARMGSFVFPGVRLARITPPTDGAEAILDAAIVTGSGPTAPGDLAFAIGQLVDIALRALSPGINDSRTALRVLDRLGAMLCHLAGAALPTGVWCEDGRVLLQHDVTDYQTLVGQMLDPIRRNARGNAMVLIHMAYVLEKAARCGGGKDRRVILARHAELVRVDGTDSLVNNEDRKQLLEMANCAIQALHSDTDAGEEPAEP